MLVESGRAAFTNQSNTSVTSNPGLECTSNGTPASNPSGLSCSTVCGTLGRPLGYTRSAACIMPCDILHLQPVRGWHRVLRRKAPGIEKNSIHQSQEDAYVGKDTWGMSGINIDNLNRKALQRCANTFMCTCFPQWMYGYEYIRPYTCRTVSLRMCTRAHMGGASTCEEIGG